MAWWEIISIAALIGIILYFLIIFIGVKKCPADKIMVISGKLPDADGEKQYLRCIHGGAKFVWPIIQRHSFMDLTPIPVEADLINVPSKQNARINVLSIFTVGISTEPALMKIAAECLLGLETAAIRELAKDIIFGQLRLIIAATDIEEINTDRDKFLEQVVANIENELKTIGLSLINVNLTDICETDC